MATRTIARLYDSYQDASGVVGKLEAAGIPHDDVSIIANQSNSDGTATTAPDAASTGAGAGATLGTLLGGGAGLLAGLGSLAIPGVGPVIAAGWLIATLTGAGVGAAAGGLLGSLTGAGVSEQEAHVYAEGVRRGGTLVSVRFDEARAAEVERILNESGPVDWQQRSSEYKTGGWDRFDDTLPPTGGAAIPATGAVAGSTFAGATTPVVSDEEAALRGTKTTGELGSVPGSRI